MREDRTTDQLETTIFGSNLELGFLYVETCDRPWATKIDKLLRRHGDVIHDYGGYSARYPHYRRVLMARQLLAFRAPKRESWVEPSDSWGSLGWPEEFDGSNAEGERLTGIDLRTEIDWDAGRDVCKIATTQRWMITKMDEAASRYPALGFSTEENEWGQQLACAVWPIECIALRPSRRSDLKPPPDFDKYGNPVKLEPPSTDPVAEHETGLEAEPCTLKIDPADPEAAS